MSMNLKVCLLCLAFGTTLTAAAQYEKEDGVNGAPGSPTWSASSGSMIYFYKQQLNGFDYNGINTLAVLGVRYNFKYLGKSTSLSVGSYPGLGVAFFSGFGQSNVFFSFDLPLLLELHTGVDAHPNAMQNGVGFFMGGGMGINFLSREFYLNNPRSGFSYGPTGGGGIKLNFGGRPITLRGSYMLNFNPDLPDLKAVGILWSMGGR